MIASKYSEKVNRFRAALGMEEDKGVPLVLGGMKMPKGESAESENLKPMERDGKRKIVRCTLPRGNEEFVIEFSWNKKIPQALYCAFISGVSLAMKGWQPIADIEAYWNGALGGTENNIEVRIRPETPIAPSHFSDEPIAAPTVFLGTIPDPEPVDAEFEDIPTVDSSAYMDKQDCGRVLVTTKGNFNLNLTWEGQLLKSDVEAIEVTCTDTINKKGAGQDKLNEMMKLVRNKYPSIKVVKLQRGV